jgi:hypothetical protein
MKRLQPLVLSVCEMTVTPAETLAERYVHLIQLLILQSSLTQDVYVQPLHLNRVPFHRHLQNLGPLLP